MSGMELHTRNGSPVGVAESRIEMECGARYVDNVDYFEEMARELLAPYPQEE